MVRVRFLGDLPMLTVAQLVELQIVVLVVASSILVCQPNGAVAHLGERLPCTEKVAGSIPVSSTI